MGHLSTVLEEPASRDHAVATVVAVSSQHCDALARLQKGHYLLGDGRAGACLELRLGDARREGSGLQRAHLRDGNDLYAGAPTGGGATGGRGRGRRL